MNRPTLVFAFALLFGGSVALAQQTSPGVTAPTGEPAATTGVATESAPAADINVTGARAQIQQLVQQLDQAALTNDTATFQRLLAPNYQATNAQGVRQDKAKILKVHRDNDIKYESIQNRGQDIQVNGNTATERSTDDIRGTYKGNRFDGTYQSTRTFERQPDGSWRIVSFEVHRVS